MKSSAYFKISNIFVWLAHSKLKPKCRKFHDATIIRVISDNQTPTSPFFGLRSEGGVGGGRKNGEEGEGTQSSWARVEKYKPVRPTGRWRVIERLRRADPAPGESADCDPRSAGGPGPPHATPHAGAARRGRG